MSWRFATRAGAALLAGMIGCNVVQAQDDYPNDTVRMVATFSPGGGVDLWARLLADAFSAKWNKAVVVENRAGASGSVGTDYAARAAPDGYTLMMTTNAPIVLNPILFPDNVRYDPLKDLEPISMVASLPFALVTHPSLPANTFEELLALAREKPGALNYGSSGIGGGAHLAGELLQTMSDVSFQHIPYPGSGPALTALVGGHIDFMFVSIQTVTPLVKEGQLKILAVSSPTRSSAFPDIPSVSEFKGFEDFRSDLWYGLFAPAGTDKAVVDKIYAALKEALDTDEMRERFEPLGTVLVATSPDEFRDEIKADIDRWSAVIDRAGIKDQL